MNVKKCTGRLEASIIHDFEFFHLFKLYRSSHQRRSIKKVFLKILQISQENTCASCRLQACNFIKKKTLAQMLSCEFCEIFKNTFLQNTSGRLRPALKSFYKILHLVITPEVHLSLNGQVCFICVHRSRKRNICI